MSLGILVGTLIVLGVIYLSVRPLVVAQRARQRLEVDEREERLESLLFARESALAAIRDAQLARSMGKLGEADFEELDRRYRAEAISIMKALDELGAGEALVDDAAIEAWIERAVAEARSGQGRAVVAAPEGA